MKSVTVGRGTAVPTIHKRRASIDSNYYYPAGRDSSHGGLVVVVHARSLQELQLQWQARHQTVPVAQVIHLKLKV